MNQQQNQQQPNELQNKAEAALSASFAMPIIRTMADDLLEVSKGVSVPVVASEPPVIVIKTVQQPTVSTKPAIESVPAVPKPMVSRSGVSPVSGVTQRQMAGNTVAMPSPLKETDSKSFVISMLVGVGVALIIGAVVLSGYLFWPKRTNTIADKIPAETIAFISVKRGSGALEKAVLPNILKSMGLNDGSLNSEWNELVYGVISGSSSSEPVSYLMTDSSASIDVSANSNLVLKKLANGNNVVVDSKETGRLDGLSGNSLADTNEYRALAKQLPVSPEYIFIGQEEATLFKSFSLLSLGDSGATLFAVKPSEQGSNMLPVVLARSNSAEFVKNQLPWELLSKAIPATAVAVAGHADVASDVDKWRLSKSDNPQMQEFLNALTAQSSAVDALKANLNGNYIVGSLVTNSPVPDGVAVLPIKDGMTALVQAQMTSLEEALRLLGPLVGGVDYKDVQFFDGNHRDVPIRFVNFGDASRTIDYAIVDSLLLVSTSKGSMEQMIDVYKGSTENFAIRFAEQATGQIDWQYLRFDENIVGRLPVALQTMLSGFKSTYFEPIKTGVYTGNIAY